MGKNDPQEVNPNLGFPSWEKTEAEEKQVKRNLRGELERARVEPKNTPESDVDKRTELLKKIDDLKDTIDEIYLLDF